MTLVRCMMVSSGTLYFGK